MIFGQLERVYHQQQTINTYLCHPGEEQNYRPNGSSGETHFSSTLRRVLVVVVNQCFFCGVLASFLSKLQRQDPVNLVRWFCNDR